MSGDSDVFISVQVDKILLGLPKHLILTSVYIPPSNSRYGNIEHFHEVDNFLLDFSDDFCHLLCGDFNFHTGTSPDFVTPLGSDEDVESDVETGLSYLSDIFIDWSDYEIDRTRYSQDTSCDRSTYGKKLLDICKNNLVLIFNGRIGEDHRVGKATTVHKLWLIM